MPDLDPDADLTQALGGAFETLEEIRQLARSYEDQLPDLFAAFMSAAVAAADGRDAILTATAMPARTRGVAGPGHQAPNALFRRRGCAALGNRGRAGCRWLDLEPRRQPAACGAGSAWSSVSRLLWRKRRRAICTVRRAS